MGIDDGCNGVGGIVKAIHELKAEGDQQRDAQQDIWVEGRASFYLQIPGEADDRDVYKRQGMDSVHQTVALTNRAAEIGYKLALVKTPSFFKGQFSKPETQMLFFRAVADQAKIPVLLYNFPQNTGIDLAAEAVAELSHHPNIVGIKESSGNVEKLMQMVRETKKGFQVLTGSATTLAPSLAIGCTGGILALSLIHI